MVMKLYLSLNGTGIAGLQQFIDKQQKDNLSAKETIKYFFNFYVKLVYLYYFRNYS